MNTLLRTLQPLVRRIDTLSRRDRLALTLGLLATALGLELLVLQPMQMRRLQIMATVQAAASAQHTVLAQAAEAQQAQQTAVKDELGRQAQALAALGLQTSSRDTLASFLSRSLAGAPVRLTALKDLPVQPIALPSEAPSTPGAAPAATLYRHRVELQMEGPLTALTQAVDGLERNVLPLRIEQVRLASRDDQGQTLLATVVMTVVNEERTWLTL